MRSFLYLFGIFYLRYIPISIFWNICPNWVLNQKKKKLIILKTVFLAGIFFVCQAISFLMFFVFPLALMNFIVIGKSKSLLTSIFLFWEIKKSDQTENSAEKMDKNLAFLLNQTILGKYREKIFQTIIFGLEILGLVLLTLGGIEASNDFRSHINPDVFDLFFPDFGGKMFWGGLSIFSLTSFFLFFVFKTQDLREWKERYLIVRKLSPFWSDVLISKSILHPYFFLSLKGRINFSSKTISQESSEKLFRLLNKAYRQNLRRIPEEWIEGKL